jgi:hypothetical protein
MSLVAFKNELVEKYGITGASAVLVIRAIEKEKVREVDLTTITEMWNNTYRELSFRNSAPNNGCVFRSFAGLIFRGQIKFRREISIKDVYTFGKNYNYVKTAINILKSDYDHKWPQTLKVAELWKQVFMQLKKREIAHNSQLHVLKALVENGMIELVGDYQIHS